MHTFFNGWRRKIGCGTLLIAMAFTLGWVRSLILVDFVGLPSTAITYFIVSHGGLLEFQMAAPASQTAAPLQRSEISQTTTIASTRQVWSVNPPPVLWGSMWLHWYDVYGVRVGLVDVIWKHYEIEWQRGFGSLLLVSGNEDGRHAIKAVVPYWIVCIPLTLLSVYLILWKPRQRRGGWGQQTGALENAAAEAFPT